MHTAPQPALVRGAALRHGGASRSNDSDSSARPLRTIRSMSGEAAPHSEGETRSATPSRLFQLPPNRVRIRDDDHAEGADVLPPTMAHPGESSLHSIEPRCVTESSACWWPPAPGSGLGSLHRTSVARSTGSAATRGATPSDTDAGRDFSADGEGEGDAGKLPLESKRGEYRQSGSADRSARAVLRDQPLPEQRIIPRANSSSGTRSSCASVVMRACERT